MNRTIRNLLSFSIILTLLIHVEIVNASEVTQIQFANHKNDVETSSSELKIQARGNEDHSIDLSSNIKDTNETKIYPSLTESRSNINAIKSTMQDSYLNALQYSHTSNDPREGIVNMDTKPKSTKNIRRTYDGPVYRPHSEYGPPKEPSLIYGTTNNVKEPVKNPGTIYGIPDATPPTQESFRPTPSDSYSLPAVQPSAFNNQNSYNSGNKYGGSQQNNYAVPSPIYKPAPVPQRIYGPPHNNYPPVPQSQQVYGPPQWSGFALPYLSQLPSLPSIDFSLPVAFKLNAFTIAKIILKLIIFKMIVKFIAVLCLLLFIPKLELKEEGNDSMEDDNNEGRKLITDYFTTDRLNNLTSIVLDSIETYQIANGTMFNDKEKCTNMGCGIKKFLKSNETWSDYLKLFNNYAVEENNAIRSTVETSPT